MFTSERQAALKFNFDQTHDSAHEIEAVNEVKCKFTVNGHYGHGSASTSINGMNNTDELPFANGTLFMRWLMKTNRPAFQDLWEQLQKAVRDEFKGAIPPKNGRIPDKQKNIHDVLYGEPFQYLLTSCQLHLQKYTAPRQPAVTQLDPANFFFSVWSQF